MVKYILHTLVLLASLLWQVTHAGATAVQQNDITRATLLSSTYTVKPGEPFKLGVLLEPKEGWHSYWENPGDAGIPTTLEWKLPVNFAASDIEWPVPERINEGPLTVYGYHNTVLLPVTITPPADLQPGQPYEFRVIATWLICLDICIPESAELSITLPTGEMAPSAHAALFETQAKTPKKLSGDFTFQLEAEKITLAIPYEHIGITNAKAAQFFPRELNVIRYPATQSVQNGNATLFISIEKKPGASPKTLSGILAVEDDAGRKHHFDIRLDATEASTADKPLPNAPQQDIFFPTLILFAILGGLILNLMPCVLPVLSLKALALLKKSGAERTQARKHGIAYTLGIMVSFGLFAGLLISLQHAGEAVGWGYQMQSPAFVGFLIYLLFMIGLNLSGVFELPVLLGNTGSRLTNEYSSRGSFFTGVLATAVATPCTAPFMASAVGVALTLPAWQSLLIFEALGLGLALPFLLLSFFPSLLRFLPKPGAWMESFRGLLAFFMYGSVIWLIWVLALQTGAGGAALALSGVMLMVFAIWMRRLFTNSHAYRVLGICVFAGVLLITLPMLGRMEGEGMMAPTKTDATDTVPYSPEALSRLRLEGKAIFVDATAAWCITCQLNAKTAIHTNVTMAAFKSNNVTLMIADWTRRNKEISEFLKSFGYQGVPLYVYYPPGGKAPVVLPQLLTSDIIVQTIKGENP